MHTIEKEIVTHRRRSPHGRSAARSRKISGSESFPVNHSRWYDSTTGRWLSQDPIGYEGGCTNLYCYCGNSPTDGVDPSGMAAIIPPVDPGVLGALPAHPPDSLGQSCSTFNYWIGSFEVAEIHALGITMPAAHTFLVIQLDDGTMWAYRGGPGLENSPRKNLLTVNSGKWGVGFPDYRPTVKFQSYRLSYPGGATAAQQALTREAGNINSRNLRYEPNPLSFGKTGGNCNSVTTWLLNAIDVSTSDYNSVHPAAATGVPGGWNQTPPWLEGK